MSSQEVHYVMDVTPNTAGIEIIARLVRTCIASTYPLTHPPIHISTHPSTLPHIHSPIHPPIYPCLVSKTVCPGECGGTRCYHNGQQFFCCDDACSAGCYGTLNDHCLVSTAVCMHMYTSVDITTTQVICTLPYMPSLLVGSFQACKQFNNNGTCLDACPPENIYNSALQRLEENPDHRVAAGFLCLRECPSEWM